MCNWMNDPAFIGYAFECDEKEREKQSARRALKRQRDWLDVMSEEEEDDDDEDGW